MINSKTAETKDRKVILSTLWIFVTFNYLYADLVMVIFNPGAYQAIAARMSQWVALGATVLMEILIAMILLSRILKYRANRWANIFAGILGTAFVAVTLSPRSPAFYIFLSAIEIASTLFIIWYAWTWPKDQTSE
ncbi:MAG TPA: DUF6326 family protein [Pyrinomonadaceae bacterium]